MTDKIKLFFIIVGFEYLLIKEKLICYFELAIINIAIGEEESNDVTASFENVKIHPVGCWSRFKLRFTAAYRGNFNVDLAEIFGKDN